MTNIDHSSAERNAEMKISIVGIQKEMQKCRKKFRNKILIVQVQKELKKKIYKSFKCRKKCKNVERNAEITNIDCSSAERNTERIHINHLSTDKKI